MNKARSANIFLISKTSYDKSASGNNILQKNVFSVDELDGNAVPKVESSNCGGRLVTVVDTPGIMDMISERQSKDAIEKFLRSWREGMDAIVIVFRFPVRMTPEEARSIEIIKDIVGETNLKKYGILLFTNGASFKHNPTQTFDDFLQKEVDDYLHKGFQNQSKESLGKLILDVGRRCVIFDNDNPEGSDAESLLSKVDQLMYRNNQKRYKKDKISGKMIKIVIVGIVTIAVIVIVVAVVVTTNK